MMKTHSYTARTAAQVTYGVWKALFLREAVTRIAGSRTAWIFLFMEPVFHIVFLMLLYEFVRVRVIGGIETGVWVMAGLLGYFMFRRTGFRSKQAISSNQALYAYRQVKPVDTVLVRAALEGILTVVVGVIVFGGAAFFGISMTPADPLAIGEAFLGLWLLGLGFGLVTSVLVELVPSADGLINMSTTVLYLLSGVLMPIASIPPPYRQFLLLNPIVHGLEAVRLGFAPYYHAIPELSIGYLFGFALTSIFLGLALHRRFAARLVTL